MTANAIHDVISAGCMHLIVCAVVCYGMLCCVMHYVGVEALSYSKNTVDYINFQNKMFDEVNSYAPDREPECILAIAAGQQHDVNVVDKEINFVATLIKIKRILGEN